MIPLIIEPIPGGYRYSVEGKPEWGKIDVTISLNEHRDVDDVCVHVSTPTYGTTCAGSFPDALKATSYLEARAHRIALVAQETDVDDIIHGNWAVLLSRR